MDMSIGLLARKGGVGLPTLRFYERRRLLAPARRKASGYRVYDEMSLKRLRFIRRAQTLGFTLKEIGELLGLEGPTPATGATCGKVMRQARAKVDQIRRKMKDLGRMEETLSRMIADCKCGRASQPCSLLECFEEGGQACEPLMN